MPDENSKSGELLIRPIAWHRGPFRQKLGIPRQAGLHEALSSLELDLEQVGPASVEGLEGVSHLWLTFGFSAHSSASAKDSVRPPRLGGHERLGIFATRSPYRHNGLGLSLVKLEGVEFPQLSIRGADLLDGTPIYDIKPYLPWAEAPSGARCDWATQAPAKMQIVFSDAAHGQLAAYTRGGEIRALIVQCLVVDPRPAYDRGAPQREFRTRIGPVDVHFCVEGGELTVTQIKWVLPDN